MVDHRVEPAYGLADQMPIHHLVIDEGPGNGHAFRLSRLKRSNDDVGQRRPRLIALWHHRAWYKARFGNAFQSR